MLAGGERSQQGGWLVLYFRPRAGMAELVDAADSKSVALKRRVGSIPSPGTNNAMKFCSNCGTPVVLKVPDGDFLPRHVCDNCGAIHYENPKLVVGSVPEYEGRILICKRGIEPRLGFWTIPAGFMENDETLEAGAAREASEEACIDVEIGSLLLLANVTHARQVHVFFRSRMRTPHFAVTHESLEVALVDERDIPWNELAFPSTEYALRRFVEDRAAGIDRHHVAEMQRRFK
jgi:ADP-ribose pyrophosphatase YjhB (NUDIX family)